MALFGRRRAPRGRRLFFATDIHGSESCFRKFVNAGKAYQVSYLVLGGDITGKAIVPVVRGSCGYDVGFGEQTYQGLDERGKDEVLGLIRRTGHYPLVGSHADIAILEDDASRDEMFRRMVYDSIGDWVTLAEERLRGSGIRLFVAPGNDDFLEIDSALTGSDVVEFAENRLIRLDEEHEMVTTGYSNPTPWETERELSEPDLRERIFAMMQNVERRESLVAVLHAPPIDSGLDNAPQLDEEFRVSVQAGAGLAMAPVGSTAVRDFIEAFQPLLGLHGHVHESGGAVRIGRTLCLNPGSQYTEGVLAGVIVELSPTDVISHQFISG